LIVAALSLEEGLSLGKKADNASIKAEGPKHTTSNTMSMVMMKPIQMPFKKQPSTSMTTRATLAPTALTLTTRALMTTSDQYVVYQHYHDSLGNYLKGDIRPCPITWNWNSKIRS
jgi:hypothetical protein